MSRQNWCKHLLINQVHGYVYAPSQHPMSATSQADTNWGYCPICGTPRPPEPKTLAEKFAKHYAYCNLNLADCWRHIAKEAESHFFDGKEEALADYLGGVGYNELSRRAINFLRGEGG